MAGKTVDEAAAAQAKGDMANAVEGMKFTIKAISDEVTQAKGWQGRSRVAFDAACVEWDGEAKRLNVLLDQLQEQVGEGTASFVRQDEEGESEFQYIRL
ncbi:WXG100 family type VII secretion target [Nocardia sp. NPDC050712]|uniref:WXG100 family type VII secretion target n=1 Tax=Nocardia sp. NPDC050712 TaxID=3155518 RepID=UPI0033EA4B40